MKHIVIALLLSASGLSQTWVEFSVVSKGYGTRAVAINSSGEVAGWYAATDNNGFPQAHGFIRNTDGTITKLTAPKLKYLFPTAINTAGEIAGYLFHDGPENEFGFYDFPPATFDQFRVFHWTSVGGLNDAGFIAGVGGSCQACGVSGFLLNPNGKTKSFSIPNATTQTYVTGLNSSNQIVGSFVDGDNDWHGFLIEAGNVLQLDVPGALGTQAESFNDHGEVVGNWWDSSYLNHGFIWTRKQGFTSFDFPHTSGDDWGVSGINVAGVVVGAFTGAEGHSHGFVRDVAGKFTILNAPHASNTLAMGINASGQVTGFYYIGTRTVAHVFIYTP
jgi:hypothetical protein